MRVEVGPVSSASALMWLAYARTILARLVARPESFGIEIGQEEIDAFEAYVTTWEDEANRSTTFHWIAEEQPDRLRRLADTWISIANVLAKEELERGFPLAHPDSLEFNHALAAGVLAAIAGDAD